jgi:hypothetical protein
VGEEGGAGDVGLLADFLHRDLVVAAFGEELHRRRVDLLPGALLLSLAPGGRLGFEIHRQPLAPLEIRSRGSSIAASIELGY